MTSNDRFIPSPIVTALTEWNFNHETIKTETYETWLFGTLHCTVWHLVPGSVLATGSTCSIPSTCSNSSRERSSSSAFSGGQAIGKQNSRVSTQRSKQAAPMSRPQPGGEMGR